MKTKPMMSRVRMSVMVISCGLCLLNGTAWAATIYVDADNSSGTHNGQSWGTAYTDVQDALTQPPQSGDRIWVAEGTYYPVTAANPDINQRYTSFALVQGVEVYGGFAGSETLLSERDWAAHETILSGDIGVAGMDTDNSIHVVTGAVDAVLDGFIVEKGYAKITPQQTCPETGSLVATPQGQENNEILRILTNIQCTAGAGLYNVHADTTARNTIFRYNYGAKGAGAYNMVVSYHDFTNPQAQVAADDPYFENVVFLENIATGRGGAVNNDFYTSPSFVNTQFLHNHCDAKGGGLYNDMGSPSYLLNVLFAYNTAERGGAVVSDGSSSSRMAYTTIVGNRVNDIGAALYQGTYMSTLVDGVRFSGNEPHLYDSIVVGNSSGASSSSIDDWHDSIAVCTQNCVLEATDGTLTVTAYLNEDYTSKDPGMGWDAARSLSESEIAAWLTTLQNDTNRTYTAYAYSNIAVTPPGTGTIYVKHDASGSNNGTSWTDAYTSLATALETVKEGQVIQVVQGTYYPTTGTDRAQAFVLKKKVTIYGGYLGSGTTRDWKTYQTILSGDIGAQGENTDNSYHVLAGVNDLSDAALDGFYIEKGYADGEWYHGRGGGMLIYDLTNTQGSALSISNCLFRNNYALEGGAMVVYYDSNPNITDCTFDSNNAERGGAMLIRVGSSPTISGTTASDVAFSNNGATDRGGAVYIDYGANPAFTNADFTSNSSVGNGGAVYVDNKSSQYPGGTNPTFTNGMVSGNSSSTGRGGGLSLYNTSTSGTGTTLTITGNSATGGGGVAYDYGSTWTCAGCAISSNTPDDQSDNDTFPAEPDIQVLRGVLDIADGTGSYDMGTRDVGSSASIEFTVKNSGDATLTISSAQVTAGDTGDFSITQSPDATVSAHRTSPLVVQFAPTASGSRSATITINSDDPDDEAAYTFDVTGTGSIVNTLTLTIDQADIPENGGTSSATVTRNTGTSGSLVVTLASDDTSEATVPATVTILDGSDSATFTITAVDDAVVDGTQTVTITASAGGYVSGTDTIAVADDETTHFLLWTK